MNCVFCNSELYPDSVYVTDGTIAVCSMCASRHSLYETAIYLNNAAIDSTVILHRPSIIDFSLNVQTEDELRDKLKSKNELNAKYGLNVQTEEADGLNVQTDDEPEVQGRIPHCPLGDCYNCHFYYGETDSCMVGEPGTKPTEEDIMKVRAALSAEEAEHFFDIDPELEDGERAREYEGVQLAHDIDNMSHDDFFSKYADNPDALHAYVNANGEPDV